MRLKHTALIVIALVAVAALVAAIGSAPVAAFPDKEADCVACHGDGSTYRGTATATPSTQYPAAGASYTVNIGTPQNPAGTYDTGYWIANSTAGGATGSSTGFFGGATGSNAHSYIASMAAPASQGVYYYKVFAVDGPKATASYTNFALYSITVDTTAPVSSASGADANWHRTPVTVSFSATDNASGVQKTEYRIDSRPWVTGTSVTLRTWRRGGNSGDHLVEYRSTDNAGNAEVAKSVHVKLDARVPITRNDAPTGVQTGPVTVHFTATDSLSGVASTWYSVNGVAFVLGTQVTLAATPTGRTEWIAYYSIDNVGNTEYVHWVSVSF